MENDLNDFYLVAISRNQEWVLNEDYNPLQLQQPSVTGTKMSSLHSQTFRTAKIYGTSNNCVINFYYLSTCLYHFNFLCVCTVYYNSYTTAIALATIL